MSNEDLFQNLKQFITVTISRQTADLGQRLDKVEHHIDKIDLRLDTMEVKFATK